MVFISAGGVWTSHIRRWRSRLSIPAVLSFIRVWSHPFLVQEISLKHKILDARQAHRKQGLERHRRVEDDHIRFSRQNANLCIVV
jgi:hypothetical protein